MDALRAEFPALQNVTYLNTATYGLLSRRSTEAVFQHLVRRDQHACSDFLEWFDDMDRLREKLARLLRAEAHDIAFLSNAATGYSLLLNGLSWQPGDEILTLKNEFPNQIYYPALLAERGVRLVEAEPGELAEHITPRTRLIAVSQASYSTGFRPALERLDRQNALLYIDATQCLGALTLDVSAIRPDMLAVNAYKWMLAPNGAGFAYVSPNLRKCLAPQVVGWRSHHDWRNVNSLHQAAPVFSEAAEKYEGGMLNFPSLYALDAAVDLFLELGPAQIEQRVISLTNTLRGELRMLPGARLYSDENIQGGDSPITAVQFDGLDAAALTRWLKAEHAIHTSARHGRLRISVHLYNNAADIEKLLFALAFCLKNTETVPIHLASE